MESILLAPASLHAHGYTVVDSQPSLHVPAVCCSSAISKACLLTSVLRQSYKYTQSQRPTGWHTLTKPVKAYLGRESYCKSAEGLSSIWQLRIRGGKWFSHPGAAQYEYMAAVHVVTR
eukprot:scaffold122175_cov22-Tisochrysis_lutea.AAC.2